MSNGFGKILEEIPLGRGWYLILEDAGNSIFQSLEPTVAHCCQGSIRRRTGSWTTGSGLCLSCRALVPEQVYQRAEFHKKYRGWKSWRDR